MTFYKRFSQLLVLTLLSFLLAIGGTVKAETKLVLEQPASKSEASDAPQLLACATCGCSEVCPLALVDPSQVDSSVLSESIWGNIILKMAYQRDPELTKMSRRLGTANGASMNALLGVAGGTLAQNMVSMAALNPPPGIEDSYGPGTVGLALDGVTNIVFGTRAVINYRYHKKIKARQLVVRQHVEQILQHLEFSKTDCSEAQADLATLIGERASKECLQLWQSSHLAAVPEPTSSTHPVSSASPANPANQAGAVGDSVNPVSEPKTASNDLGVPEIIAPYNPPIR